MEQLSYGSADQIAGRQVGGWGVLHATPDLTAGTRDALLPLASVAMAHTLPQFPSAAQLAARPARFRVDPDGEHLLACRSVEAGPDHTGRPGNVVSHCARVPHTPRARPVDWFFATGWLSPYGPRQVAESAPPAELGEPVGWPQTAAWLGADPARVARLRWILDVSLALLLETGCLVLRAPTADEGARWLSLLSWVLDPATAAQVRLRVGEDAVSLPEQLRAYPLIAVIGADVPVSAAGSAAVVDTSLSLDVAEAERSGSWAHPSGRTFPASAAARVAADLVFAPAETAAAVFALRDELAARLATPGRPMPAARLWLLLWAAWLLTPGAQDLARAEPIRALLSAADPELLAWDELRALAAEVGAAEPAAEQVDVYTGAPTPVDPWAVEDEADGVLDALLGAAALGAAGLDVEAVLRSRALPEGVEHSEELRRALRSAMAVLPHPTHDGEDR